MCMVPERAHSPQGPKAYSPKPDARVWQRTYCMTDFVSNMPAAADMEEELHALQQALLLPSTVDDLLAAQCE